MQGFQIVHVWKMVLSKHERAHFSCLLILNEKINIINAWSKTKFYQLFVDRQWQFPITILRQCKMHCPTHTLLIWQSHRFCNRHFWGNLMHQNKTRKEMSIYFKMKMKPVSMLLTKVFVNISFLIFTF